MATIKAFSDLEQSKKLANILPPESADMMWKKELKYRIYSDEHKVSESDFMYSPLFRDSSIMMQNFDIPCWSLASLLDVLPNNENISTTLSKGGYRISTLEYTNSWFVDYEDETDGLNNCVTSADNPIDACYEIIIKLHELNLL